MKNFNLALSAKIILFWNRLSKEEQNSPQAPKNKLSMLNAFEIFDSKPNWQKKSVRLKKCIIHPLGKIDFL